MGAVDHQPCAHLTSPITLQSALPVIYLESIIFDDSCQFISDDYLTCARAFGYLASSGDSSPRDVDMVMSSAYLVYRQRSDPQSSARSLSSSAATMLAITGDDGLP